MVITEVLKEKREYTQGGRWEKGKGEEQDSNIYISNEMLTVAHWVVIEVAQCNGILHTIPYW